MKKLIYIIFGTCLFIVTSLAQAAPPANTLWSLMFYYGKMTNNTLGQVLGLNYSLNNQPLYSLELAKNLSETNPIKTFFAPIFPIVQFAANITYRNDRAGDIAEFAPYLMWRLTCFPWNKFVDTSLAIGEGISYASKVPYRETLDSNDTRKLLNYLMFEATFAVPRHPYLQLVARIHHRSGVFGLYKAGNSGSTAVGLGIRLYF